MSDSMDHAVAIGEKCASEIEQRARARAEAAGKSPDQWASVLTSAEAIQLAHLAENGLGTWGKESSRSDVPTEQHSRPSRLSSAAPSVVAALLFLGALTVQAQAGVASWYGDEHRGRPMANCQPFNPDALTCASWFYPLGTRLHVRCNDRAVSVVVTDRGPARRLVRAGRVIDLSRAAFAHIADTNESSSATTPSKP